MAGNINAAYDEADRVVKKQRTCASLTTDALRKSAFTFIFTVF